MIQMIQVKVRVAIATLAVKEIAMLVEPIVVVVEAGEQAGEIVVAKVAHMLEKVVLVVSVHALEVKRGEIVDLREDGMPEVKLFIEMVNVVIVVMVIVVGRLSVVAIVVGRLSVVAIVVVIVMVIVMVWLEAVGVLAHLDVIVMVVEGVQDVS